MSAERLLVLGGASPLPGADTIAQARARGVEVCVADTARNLAAAPEVVAAAAEAVALDYTDVAACVAWARTHPPFLGVYGFRELAAEPVAAVAEALGLPGNPLSAVRLVRDKQACRAFLAARGFRQPAAVRCRSRAQAREFLAAGPGPWVVKPPAAWGSAGVSLLRRPEDLDAALGHLAAGQDGLADELSGQGLRGPVPGGAGFLVERFQAGVEYSAEGVFVAGEPVLLAVTGKRTAGPPYFVETGHVLPLPPPPALAPTLRAALPALGLRWGVLHVEFWLDGEDVVLGEVHVRPGGDYIHVMTQHVTGVELHGTAIDQLLGRPFRPPGPPDGAAAVRFAAVPPGRVRSVSGWDEVRADPCYLAGRLALAPGDVVPPVRSSADRTAAVVAAGPTPAAAEAAAARLLDRLHVTTDVLEDR